MFNLQPVHTIVFLAAILLIGKCYAYGTILQQEVQIQECKGCGNECDKCVYGVTKSFFCNVEVCQKGPGERCGGPNDSLGICGEGLMCKCGRCNGCSLDSLSCYEVTCLPHQTWQQRGHHEMNRVYIDVYGNIRSPDEQRKRRMDERRIREWNMEQK